MKRLCFLGILLTCFVVFTSTLLNAAPIERTFTVKNKSVSKVLVAYCYGISEKDVQKGLPAGYYIKGWEYVNPGYSKECKMESSFKTFFVYVQRADGEEYKVPGEPSEFYIQPEGENFQVIQRFGDGKVLYHTGNQSSLQGVTFYKYVDGRAFTINGPLAIQDDPYRFDGDYDTRGFSRQGTGTDYALLFATNKYEHWRALSTPIADAEAIGAELENRYRFKVDIRKNVTIEDILAALAEYKVKRYAPGDQLLIYFAGHGKFDEVLQDGHIAGTESKSPKDDKNLATLLAFSKLRDNIDIFPCERIMLMLDVCYGGTFDKDLALGEKPPEAPSKPRTRGAEPLNLMKLQETLAVKTRWYLSSGGNEDVSDGLGPHSPFALALLTLLRNGDNGDGVLTVPEIERQLPPTLENELDKVRSVYKGYKIKQSPVSGPFGSGKAADKAFLFIDRTHAQGQQSGLTTN